MATNHRQQLAATLNSVAEIRKRELCARFENIEPNVWQPFGNDSRIRRTPKATDDGEIVGYDWEIKYSQVDQLAEEAAQYRDGLTIIFECRKSLSQAALCAMWHVYRRGLICYMGSDGKEYNPEDFAQWAVDTFTEFEDVRWIRQLTFVVERVLQQVHDQQLNGTPFLDSTKSAITVDSLIDRYGLVYKLISISSTFSHPGATHADKSELLDAVVNRSREDVESTRDKVSGKKMSITIPYREQRVGMDEDGNELFDLICPGLTGQQVQFFVSLLGEAGKQTFS